MSRPTVVIELAGDAQFSRDLAVGGVFVPGCTLRLTDECELVVCGASSQLSLPARVVYVEEHRGVGLELIGFSSEMKARLAELEPVSSELGMTVERLDDASLSDGQIDLARLAEYDQAPAVSVALIDLDALGAALDDDLAIPLAGDTLPPEGFEPEPEPEPEPDPDPLELDLSALEELGGDDPDDERPHAGDGEGNGEGNGDGNGDGDYPDNGGDGQDADGDVTVDGTGSGTGDGAEGRRGNGPRAPRNVHERLRGLNLATQIKVATSGELHERIVLERLYGKNVWETLLRNPRLTAPEVARIARYGSLPRVLLEIIVGNGAWLQIPEVRRALLSNPRLGTDQIVKVLRLTPKHELKLAAIQTAYPFAVRNAARMLMRE